MDAPPFPEFEDQPETFLIIPKERLSAQALESLINEFILREGTDYGLHEVSLDEKKRRVLSQLDDRSVKILFSSKTQDTTLVSSSEIPFAQLNQ